MPTKPRPLHGVKRSIIAFTMVAWPEHVAILECGHTATANASDHIGQRIRCWTCKCDICSDR
jgi:hypothetical protein